MKRKLKITSMNIQDQKYKIGVIGLGYVGLPLALEFSKKYQTIGYDINKTRVVELKKGIDSTKEVDLKELALNLDRADDINLNAGLSLTYEIIDLSNCDILIVTVPTPIDSLKKPDLEPLKSATRELSKIISKGNIIVYESTVYPGATEEICVPIIEKISGFELNKDFFVGYSPERINPGDKSRNLTDIVKVTSGSNRETALKVDNLYKSIISKGTFLASSIKVAESAKIIENTQRDINIAFVNELAKIFNKMNIDTNEVLDAASTKWNFLNFRPGLVGGHCIGVDPYYLAEKSKEIGYTPKVILSGREVNDSMSNYVTNIILKKITHKKINIKKSKTLILGITFKENCPDFRNTKVIEIYQNLVKSGSEVYVYDPIVDQQKMESVFNVKFINELYVKKFNIIILAVSHKEFKEIKIEKLLEKKSFVYDIKGFLTNYDSRL